ncbi:Rad52/Rad22 family DNA repair protein, partial [Singulisphaera rosea]
AASTTASASSSTTATVTQRNVAPHNQQSGSTQGNPPRSGKALFAWTRDQEQRHSVGLLKYLNGWAKLQEFPGRIVDWDAEQVSLAYAEACRKLHALQSASSEALEEALSN